MRQQSMYKTSVHEKTNRPVNPRTFTDWTALTAELTAHSPTADAPHHSLVYTHDDARKTCYVQKVRELSHGHSHASVGTVGSLASGSDGTASCGRPNGPRDGPSVNCAM